MLKHKEPHVANETKQFKDELAQLHKRLVNDAQLQDLAIVQDAVNPPAEAPEKELELKLHDTSITLAVLLRFNIF